MSQGRKEGREQEDDGSICIRDDSRERRPLFVLTHRMDDDDDDGGGNRSAVGGH